MKKLCVASIVCSSLLIGCSTTDLMEMDGNRYFQVLQVLNDGSFLAFRCTKMIGDRCSGPIVKMPSGTDPMPYDEKVIHLNNPQMVDTYTYTTRNEVVKTVPVIVDKK